MIRRRMSGLLRGALRDPETSRRLARIEAQLKESRRRERRLLGLALTAQQNIEALVRHAYVPAAELGFPERLTVQRFGVLSQNAEDGIVHALVRAAGTPVRRFVEIGCGPNGGNSGFLARELGFAGVMIDGSDAALAEARLRFNEERVALVEARVTRENVNQLLSEHGASGDIDHLGLDIDGNDLWVWEAIDAVSPRVVSLEYNAVFGPTRSVTIPYDADWSYASGSSYFGASLTALTRASERKGYRLVAVEPRGANAFFLRHDVAPEVPAIEPAAAFFPLLGPEQLYGTIGGAAAAALHGRTAELEASLREGRQELVEIE